MSKISRFSGNLLAFAKNAIGTERTVFGDTVQSDTLDANLNSDFFRGWGDNVVAPNQYPTRQDFNAMGFTLGQLLAYLHQMGVAEYDELQEYHTGSICTKSGIPYVSLTDSNVGNNPETDFVNWGLLSGNRLSSGTAWGVTASYNGKTKDLSAESAGGAAIFLKPDGLKLFRAIGSDVFAYTMATANDPSMASYDGVTFATSATVIRGLFFKPDGTKMYVLDNNNETVYEYTLTIAWLISSAGSEVTFDLGSVTAITDAEGLFINPDGEKLYSLNSSGAILYEYNLPTPWSVVGITDSGNTLSVAGQDFGMRAICATPDGTKFFLIGSNNDSIYQYSFGGTPWSLFGAAYDSKSFSLSETTTPFGLSFSSDGLSFIILNSDAVAYSYDTRVDYTQKAFAIGSDDTCANAETNAPLPHLNDLVIYRGTNAFLSNCNRIQLRNQGTPGQYEFKLPEGLTFDELAFTACYASSAGFQVAGRFYRTDSTTGAMRLYHESGGSVTAVNGRHWYKVEIV